MNRPSRAGIFDAIALLPAVRSACFGVREAVNLLLPTSCAVCELPDHVICPACRQALKRALAMPPISDELRAVMELPQLQEQILVCAAGHYANELSRAILAFKNNQRVFLARIFAPYLAALIRTMIPPLPEGQQVFLVPVPSSHRAQARRGYLPLGELLNQAYRLQLLTDPLRYKPLLRYRLSQSLMSGQKTKTAAQRRTATRSMYAFQAREPNQPVLLVDDVLTTGATLRQAATVCRLAGYQVLGAVVLAITAPPNTREN